MELKPIKNYKKANVPTIKETKNKMLNFLIENKKITISTILMLLICNKSLAISGNLPPTAGVLPYEPTPFEEFIDIFFNIAPVTIIISIITIIIFNIISNKKYEKILNHDEEKTFKKKKLKTIIIILAIILLIWLLASLIIYKLFSSCNI